MTVALKDTFRNLINYFEVDDSNTYEEKSAETYQMPNETPKMRVAQPPVAEESESSALRRTPSRSQTPPAERDNLQRLNNRQKELLSASAPAETKTIIDIKFPKKYEEAPEIVNLLLDNASVLIDFQFMSETQARRCLDYLDGARSVLSGNLKKVSNTMWLLTPVNVTVNIEELRSTNPHQESNFDFDMRH